MLKIYLIPIIGGCVTLVAVYLNHRSRMKLLRELKSEFETTTHQPAESIKTHKPTEEYIKFLEKPSKKKALKKISIFRPSQSAFKTFLFGLLSLAVSSLLLAITNPFLMFLAGIIGIYGFYLIGSSFARGFYKVFSLLLRTIKNNYR